MGDPNSIGMDDLLTAITGGTTLQDNSDLESKHTKLAPNQGAAGNTKRRGPELHQQEPGLRDVTVPVPEPSRPMPQTFDEAEGFVPEIGHELQGIEQARADQDYLIAEEKRLATPIPKYIVDEAEKQLKHVERLGYNAAAKEWLKLNVGKTLSDFANWVIHQDDTSKGLKPAHPADYNNEEVEHIFELLPYDLGDEMRRRYNSPDWPIDERTGLKVFPEVPRKIR